MRTKELEVNTLGRDFVVGDLHGCISYFERALEHLGFDKAVDRVFSVGDLIDRGPESGKCLDLLKQPWFHAVRGNHETFLKDCVIFNDPLATWMQNGGQWFMGHSDAELNAWAKAVDELPIVITVGDKFRLVHAELSSDEKTSVWGRRFFGPLIGVVVTDRLKRKTVRRLELQKLTPPSDINTYCGHSVVVQPTSIGKLINIDTGAFLADKESVFGLTVTEPATGKFWKVTKDKVEEVSLVTVME